jgi:hypothetical protein
MFIVVRISQMSREAKRGACPKNTGENSQGSGEPGWLAGGLPLVPLGGECDGWLAESAVCVSVLADMRRVAAAVISR